MSSADLIFDRPQVSGQPVNLVFGDEGQTVPIGGAIVTISGAFPAFGGTAHLATSRSIRIAGAFPVLGGTAPVVYNSDTQRPTVGQVGSRFQLAGQVRAENRLPAQPANVERVETRGQFQAARPLPQEARAPWQEAATRMAGARTAFQEAFRQGTPVARVLFQEGQRARTGRTDRFQEAIRQGTPTTRSRYEDALRDRRNMTAARFQSAVGYFVQLAEKEGYGRFFSVDWASRYQEARRPPIGQWDFTVVIPPGDPCYVPPLGNAVELLFAEAFAGSPDLLFVCERHVTPPPPDGNTVVVPVREVYLTINSATLVRLDTGAQIPTTSMGMSLDVDSWTWTFQATVPGGALSLVQPNSNGDPVVVQATVNGTPFRFVVEGLSRDRSYNRSSLSVRGRGLAAELDSPYAPTLSFGNTAGARTARQLLDDILTVNGVPMNWSIGTFAPTDWTVPQSVFSHRGSYISAINAVAGAVGAYVQPHNVNRSLDVLLRYPTPSWAWSSVTPDYELPAAVTTREGIEWANKPEMNRVYVSGQDGGVLVRYTRAGTAGDEAADSVVDPLITAEAAGRQRGRAILSAGGRVATVSLRLPVLSETGIIKPGKFVRYVDGSASRVGITRSVSVDVSMPTIYQTLSVETHE